MSLSLTSPVTEILLYYPMPGSVSLSYELAEILDALRGIRLLIEPLQEGVDGPARIESVTSTISVLTMTTIRLRQVVDVVRGDEDPAKLLERHNLIPAGFQSGPEVLLKPWSTDKAVVRTEERLGMLKRSTTSSKKRKAAR